MNDNKQLLRSLWLHLIPAESFGQEPLKPFPKPGKNGALQNTRAAKGSQVKDGTRV